MNKEIINKYRTLYIFFIFQFLVSTYAFADCSSILRLEVSKRKGIDTGFLFSRELDFHIKSKSRSLLTSLRSYGSIQKRMANKKGIAYQKLKEILKSNALEPFIAKALKIVRKGSNNTDLVAEWVENLYNDVIAELYLSRNDSDIESFEMSFQLLEKSIISVLLQRSKEGGFSGEVSSIEKVEDELTPFKMAKILKSKKLIYDSWFRFGKHGHLIHLFQIDLMIYSFKHYGISPSVAVDIYSWMGSNKIMTNFSSEKFRPIDAWTALFDSFDNDFSSPEILNPILRDFFEWKFYPVFRF